LFKPKNINTNK